MEEIKKILGNLWKAIIKLILSKTDLDEKLAEKVDTLNEKVKSIDAIDEKEVKPTDKTEEELD